MKKEFYVEVEETTNNIIASYEANNFEAVYDVLVDALQAYVKKGSIESLDGFMSSCQFDLYINYSWAISPQQIQGIKRKIENLFKKF